MQTNLANCLHELGRIDEALAIEREVYANKKKLLGTTDKNTLISGKNLAHSLVRLGQHAEAKTLLRKLISQSRRAHGSNHEMTLGCRAIFALALYSDARASRGDVSQAAAILEEVTRYNRRVLGKHHPDTLDALTDLERARMKYEDVP